MPVERITFEIAGDRVSGDLHVPAGLSPHPAALVAGPMTSIKEQVTGVYAAALATRGVAALAIDHRGYGESGGSPRQYEHWGRKLEDLEAAFAVLLARSEVDPERTGMVGVCLGAGYAAHVTAREPRVRFFAGVAGYYRDPDALRVGDPDGFAAKVAQGVTAREHYERTGEILTFPAVGLSGDSAMSGPDTYDYYTRRAAVPEYVPELALMSREHFLPFDVQAAAPHIHVPSLMIHSERALSPAWARKFHDALGGPKRLEWIESQGQTDIYDDVVLVGQAADAIAGFIRTI
jgi:uncharacterized protein